MTNWMDGTTTDIPDAFRVQSSMAALSYLLLTPPTPEGPAGPSNLPTVVAVRSHLPTSPSQFSQEVHSTIDRWELRESVPPIHPAFETLGSQKRGAGGLSNVR